jgi:ATP-dependent protease ClpP protease subunit
VKPYVIAAEQLITPRIAAARARRRSVEDDTQDGREPGWYKIRAQEDGTAEILIYDEIGYWGITAADFARELAGVTASTLNIRLNSPGGEVFDGVAIYNSLLNHPAAVKNVTVEGLAASIASVIMQAGTIRQVMPASQTMIHDAWGIVIGPAADMREYADVLDNVSAMIAGVYAARSGTADGWRDAMLAETWYSAEEAVAAGLADSVYSAAGDTVDRSSSADLLTRTWDLAIFQHAGRGQAPAPTVHSGQSTVDSDPVEQASSAFTGLADLIRKAVA